jgi:hypothetical protein
MKLVIDTQFCENYDAHAWDGEGQCPQRWKFKGGETYVVSNITPAQQARIERDGIPTISALVEYGNDYAREYIINYRFVEDADQVGKDWETPYELSWEQGRWVARRTVNNDEYGYMHRAVAAKHEQYDMRLGGERDNYQCMYTLRDGRVLNNSETNAALAAFN